MTKNFLNIVDENGDVIGKETRYKIHQEGLLHKIVHVWFCTPAGELIFQRRGPTAETHPNQLDATAGGHVEIGQTDTEAALAELKEETGVVLSEKDIVKLGVEKLGPMHDEKTGTFNAHLVLIFGYLFGGDICDLKPESNEDGGIGFEAIALDKIPDLSDSAKENFIPALLKPNYMEVYKKIKDIIK